MSSWDIYAPPAMACELTVSDALNWKFLAHSVKIPDVGEILTRSSGVLEMILLGLELDQEISRDRIFTAPGFPLLAPDDPRVTEALQRGARDWDIVHLNQKTEIKEQMSAPDRGNVFIDITKLRLHGEGLCPFWCFGIPNHQLTQLPLILLMKKDRLLALCDNYEQRRKPLKRSDMTGSYGYTPELDTFIRDMYSTTFNSF